MTTQDLALDVMLNPWTGEERERRHHSSDSEVDVALSRLRDGAVAWRAEPRWSRADRLRAAGDAVLAHESDLVDALVVDIGKPRRAAAMEVSRTASLLHMCAAYLTSTIGEAHVPDAVKGGEGRWSLTVREPLGVAALITPFNAPLNLLMQKLAPALAMGNTAVVKPSPEGARVTEVLLKAIGPNFPEDTIATLFGGQRVVERIVSSPIVQVVSFTGGSVAGNVILSASGLKPVYLELGSNSPNIVLADADLSKSATQIARASFEASGQQCISAQRILVESSVKDEFLALLVEAAKGMKVGDPSLPATDIGPMVHSGAVVRVKGFITDAEAAGTSIVLDGRRYLAENERLIGPTIIDEPDRTSRIRCEEVFGPVVSVTAVADLDEALAIANDVPGMLQAACFTRDLGAAMRASKGLWAGAVWINEATRFRLDQYPFGGTGTSGLGREGVKYALEAFSRLKHIGVAPA